MELKPIYADNAATTPMRVDVTAAYWQAMTETWGNPSSIHPVGKKAEVLLNKSCHMIAKRLNCDADKIIFTSGGSEADNQAILSAAQLGARVGKKEIISTVIEHPAVSETLDYLWNLGYSIKLLGVDEYGRINLSELEETITDNTCLVSIMAANNEIGTIQPIQEIGEICDRHGVLFHTDAVQAVGHIPIDFKTCKIDYLSASSHKFGGPRGVGFLVCSDREFVRKTIFGGSQQHNLRAGTVNVAGAYATAAALEDEDRVAIEKHSRHLRDIKEYLVKNILEIPGTMLNGPLEGSLSGTMNFSFENVNGESLVLLLGEEGIYASSGSACHSGDLTPSHVLLAIGRSEELATNSLRLSLSNYVTMEDAARIVEAVKKCVKTLRGLYFN